MIFGLTIKRTILIIVIEFENFRSKFLFLKKVYKLSSISHRMKYIPVTKITKMHYSVIFILKVTEIIFKNMIVLYLFCFIIFTIWKFSK